MLDAKVEEMLEDLYVAQVERDAQGQAPDASTAAMAASLGLVESAAAPHLTPAGMIAARDVVRRHRLAERLLTDVLSVAPGDVDAGACEFEHILQRGLDEKVCILLGHPTTCPHGRPIPPGGCCQQAPGAMRQVGPLCDGEQDAVGTVAYLQTADQQETQKLMALGVLPGVEIRVLRRSPCYVFQVGYSQFAIDAALAGKILIHWHDEPAPQRHRRRRGWRRMFGRRDA
jgi:DtxR family Mn-dependent transcriptional regulator